MDDHTLSPLGSHAPETQAGPGRGQQGDVPGLRSSLDASRRLRDLDEAEPDFQEEAPPEEVAGEEFLDTPNPEEALSELERVLGQEEVCEARGGEACHAGSVRKWVVSGVARNRLSITQKFPSAPAKGSRRRRRRLTELAKPKTNWQVLRDRLGCRCKGYAWISWHKMDLQFCLYWPSVYWTDRFLEDTTLSITMPVVSPRVEELARPRRFYLEYYNNNRTTPIWPIPRPTLEYQASSRLKALAAPKVRSNMWSINVSEVSQVSRAAQMAVPTPRILQLAKPRAPAPLLEEWDPVPRPKPHVSDYSRLLHLAMPKAQSDKCVPDRAPRWEVLDAAKRAVASPRTIALAKPKVRQDFNQTYNPYSVSPASLVARASPRLQELAAPKHITRQV
ncbi:testicular haploid expressed gene protein [Tupaia chinensis]|uniref:testicular haploid expressed gene protein n=1 Tax=Tupaia chinensis TaxID=246437 RepID=UPI0003C8F6BB|nr:testicular haploid expressed gene protein [Tupaia chinensis]